MLYSLSHSAGKSPAEREKMVKPDYAHISQFDREELKILGEDIQRVCSNHGRRMKKGSLGKEICLSTFHLGVAISNFSQLNGTMAIWASFTPTLFGEGEEIGND